MSATRTPRWIVPALLFVMLVAAIVFWQEVLAERPTCEESGLASWECLSD